MMPLFSLKNLSLSYGKHQVIRDLDLQIEEGELCALLGLNGSGKTSILRAICGFIPMTGECLIQGKNCRSMNAKERARQLSLIPQQATLEGGKSVLDMVLMGYNARLPLLASPSAAQRREAYLKLDKLGIAQLAERDFGELSQGQKQLVILARCLAQDTPLMLMDEPDSALDFLNRHLVLGKIREIVRAEHKAGLLTLHDPNFAMAYCDRLLLLSDGRIRAEIHMQRNSREQIRTALSLLYGAIELLPGGSSYLMGKAPESGPTQV